MRLSVLSLLALALPATAQTSSGTDDPIDQRLALCMDEDPSTAGMVRCLDEAYDAWDAALNDAYARVMAELEPDAQDALREAQRQWLAWRDAEFAALDAFYGALDGTMWIPIDGDRKVSVVRQRARELRDYWWALHPEDE